VAPAPIGARGDGTTTAYITLEPVADGAGYRLVGFTLGPPLG